LGYGLLQLAINIIAHAFHICSIIYLTFQAFPIIFKKHHFEPEFIGLTFLGLGLGMVLATLSTPFWNKFYRREAAKNNGVLQPEKRLIAGMIGGVLAPISLFWLAFTTYSTVHWIVPILASVPFGISVIFIFTSSWVYLVTLYHPWAASVMASNTFMRCVSSGGFPLFAGAMYHTLHTDGATALLAGLCTLMAPLP
jgi:MFS family permease